MHKIAKPLVISALSTVLGLSVGLAEPGIGLGAALAQQQQQNLNQQNLQQQSLSFHDLAQSKLPAVVSVISTRQPGTEAAGDRQQEVPPGMRDFFERFFGQPPGEGLAPNPGVPGPSRALGSGFVIDPAGYVVTNNHVVEGAESVRIVLQDDSELVAEIVGTDPQTDLAVLKVEPDEQLPSLEWGNSDTQARVGDWVVAIGNPFGLGGTVTAGIVSARARDIQMGPYDDFIQTDASINRGNSGGPLIAVGGQVVGVNTAIFSPTGGNVGIGFAVPSSVAQPIVQQLRKSGTVERGWLGVHIQNLSEDLATAMGLDRDSGAVVTSVVTGSPAAQAGVEVGDVILRFAGTDIAELRDLPRAVARHPVGQTAEITVWRDGERVTLSTQIARLESETGEQPQDVAETGDLGLALAPLSSDTRARLGLDEGINGALVSRVVPGSPAAEQGVRPGDVIVRIGGNEVSSPDTVVSAISEARAKDKESIAVLLQSGDQRRFVALPLSK